MTARSGHRAHDDGRDSCADPRRLMILVDTNVLLDVFEDDPEWADWFQANLDAATATDTLAINPIIYSELSIAFARIEELEAVIAEASLNMESIPREALRPSRGPLDVQRRPIAVIARMLGGIGARLH
jgi:predicted nucleic acid-binding protein